MRALPDETDVDRSDPGRIRFSSVNLEIGVVCGGCDAYNAMGTPRCVACSHDLVLYREAVPSVRPAPIVAPVSVRPPQPLPRADVRRDGTLPPLSMQSPVSIRSALPVREAPPVSERRAGLRPQAPEVLPQPVTNPGKSGPRVEVIEAPVAPIERASQSSKGQADSSSSVRAKQDEWGHDTTGKIPLRAPRTPAAVRGSKARSKEELMDQAHNYVCRSCQTPVPSGHKFCGRCGAAVPPDILSLREEFYGQLQVPGKAKLILIRAEGDPSMEGLSFALAAAEHIVGRQGHLTFPEDRFVSPRHANLFYRDQTLVVRDEGSLNGVYVRVRGTVDAQPGDMFLAGEEVFRIDATPKATDHPEADGTYFWSSPKRPSPFRITQMLQGGAPGNVVCAKEVGVSIGREGGEMNFPADIYMSANHCKIQSDPAGKLSLTDLGSRNGTYVRLRTERELAHGDYIFIGKKILRVEVTS